MEIDGRPVEALRLVLSRFRARIVTGRQLAWATGGTLTIDGDRVVLEITDPDVIEIVYEYFRGLDGVTVEVEPSA